MVVRVIEPAVRQLEIGKILPLKQAVFKQDAFVRVLIQADGHQPADSLRPDIADHRRGIGNKGDQRGGDPGQQDRAENAQRIDFLVKHAGKMKLHRSGIVVQGNELGVLGQEIRQHRHGRDVLEPFRRGAQGVQQGADQLHFVGLGKADGPGLADDPVSRVGRIVKRRVRAVAQGGFLASPGHQLGLYQRQVFALALAERAGGDFLLVAQADLPAFAEDDDGADPSQRAEGVGHALGQEVAAGGVQLGVGPVKIDHRRTAGIDIALPVSQLHSTVPGNGTVLIVRRVFQQVAQGGFFRGKNGGEEEPVGHGKQLPVVDGGQIKRHLRAVIAVLKAHGRGRAGGQDGGKDQQYDQQTGGQTGFIHKRM